MRARSALTLAAATLVALLAGCADEEAAVSAAAPPKVTTMGSAEILAHAGLSAFPTPADPAALHRSMREHYPAELLDEGRRGSVLVDLALDEQGVVRGVEVVTPPEPDARMKAVLVEPDPRTGGTRERVVQTRYDAAFGPAARAALKGARFTPALGRDGKPVPYTLRMTVEFAPPAATE
jgi:outer membrane biosynthesis protein TonB